MIEINLVPEQQRKKRKIASHAKESVSVPAEKLTGIAVGLVILLGIMHVLLQIFIGFQFTQNKKIAKELEIIAPQKNNVDRVVMELRKLQEKAKAMAGITTTKKIQWAVKLNEISDNVPRGLWLNRLTWEDNNFVIHGSSVSKQKSEIISVHEFTAKLKGSEPFMRDFHNIELGLIKSRQIGETQVVDFTITAEVKE